MVFVYRWELCIMVINQCMNENVFQVLTYLHNDGNAIFYEIGQDHIRSTGILHVALLWVGTYLKVIF